MVLSRAVCRKTSSLTIKIMPEVYKLFTPVHGSDWQTSVWPSWYGVQDELSIEEPSTTLPPTSSVSHLDMPPPYEAVSGEDDLKPPPYSECALVDETDAPCPSHCTPLIPEEGDSSSINEAPPPYTASPFTQVSLQDGPISLSECESASRSA